MKGGANAKRKGSNFEREVKAYLESKGFFCIRQPRSAFPDLLAIEYKDGVHKVYCIECKMNKYISGAERGELQILKFKFGMIPFIAYRISYNHIGFCDMFYNETFI